MAKEKDRDIEVRYRKVKKDSLPKTETNTKETDLRNKILDDYRKFLRIIAIILSIVSIFILLSLLSFSPADEFVVGFSIKDYIQALIGAEEVIAKFRQVSNLMGPLGALVSHTLVTNTIGYFSIVFPLLLLIWSIKLLVSQRFAGKLVNWTIVSLLFVFCLSGFVGSFNFLLKLSIPYYWIGKVGDFLSTVASNFLGSFGSFAFYFTAMLLIVIFSFNIKIEKLFEQFIVVIKSIFKQEKDNIKISDKATETEAKNISDSIGFESQVQDSLEDKETAQILIRNFEREDEIENEVKEEFREFEKKEFVDLDIQEEESEMAETSIEQPDTSKKLVVFVEDVMDESKGADEVKNQLYTPISTLNLDEKINYTPPPIDLLIDDESKFQINEEELKQNAKLLQEKLETFKIYIENLTVTPGPVVTQYEFVPAPGIKISRIQSLADDIALGLKAKGIRIIAPVPGKGTVGIEIPNKKPLVVRFGNCLKNARINPNFHLPIILGKTISGEVFVEDLARMPHLLIAGATGSGKSVGINTIIASLIYKMHPQNMKFVIIDPKKVELTHYQQLLYHFLAVSPEIEDAIVTEPSDAVLVLKALVAEMQSRYDILASVHQKNIHEYNKKVREGLFRNDPEFIHRPMPYIVTIIDELADLMLTTGKEIEGLIVRLAQLARAVGIHLVVATQRPSVDIITGLIKANFPARISYLVASRVDSRTIIDTNGAEQLLGNGDMLFLPNGWPNPIRIQNAFLTTEEIEKICDFIGNQKGFSKPYYLPKVEDGKSGKETFDREGFDPLFEDAARLIIRYQQASVSMLQRRLKIGYNRAGRIMDELEMAGIVGPFDGSKGRTIKIATEDELDRFLNEKGI
ncbi:MAG: DNA translocase FtsK 4TM domain-containing protein [Ignavibacteria bacterium]|nr:DNA translocase FtsK 4TM domain-containing protein [Ignavibacteria bacterium]